METQELLRRIILLQEELLRATHSLKAAILERDTESLITNSLSTADLVHTTAEIPQSSRLGQEPSHVEQNSECAHMWTWGDGLETLRCMLCGLSWKDYMLRTIAQDAESDI